jgi:hypothetical protein
MLAADPKLKEISRQQEIDDLPPPVGANRETPCRAPDDPVPALDATLLRVDLLVPLIPRHDSERLQCLRYRSRACDALVRPHRFMDIQASSVGVHFSSSIVRPCDAKHLDDGRTELIFGKITERTTT